ncbi:hypothetical protein SeLEV6574_g04240 [Synchytrium endobioticum]|nr:hypothetical protein SeLEV6574_g04240 [Synchytrium endobioticum]
MGGNRKAPTATAAEDDSSNTSVVPRRSRRTTDIESPISSSSHTLSPSSNKKRKAQDPHPPPEEASAESRYPKRSRSLPTSPSSTKSESKRKRLEDGTNPYEEHQVEPPTGTSPRRKRQAALVAASNIATTLSSGRKLSKTDSSSSPISPTMSKDKNKAKKFILLDDEDAPSLAAPSNNNSNKDDDEEDDTSALSPASPDKQSKSRSRNIKKERTAKKSDNTTSGSNKVDGRPSRRRSKTRQGDPEPLRGSTLPDASSDETATRMDVDPMDNKGDETITTATIIHDPPTTDSHDDESDEDDEDGIDDDFPPSRSNYPTTSAPAANSNVATGGSTTTATNIMRNLDILAGMSRTTLSPRWKETLESVKSGEPDRQERALQEIANLLAMTQEGEFSRTMSGFSIDDFVRAWLEILQLPMPELDDSIAQFISELGDAAQDFLEELDPTHSGPIRVLCLRCLTNLLDVNPPSALHLIAHDGVQVLVDHCLSITRNEHRDIAENALAVMERLARDYGEAVVKAGGLEACLNKLEFYSPHYQRIGAAAASFACTRLPLSRAATPPAVVPHTLNMIELCVPYLPTLLNHHDAKVVENIVRATSHVVQWASQWEEVGDRILGVAGHDLLSNAQKLITPATSGSAPSAAFTNPTIFSQIVKLFSAVSKGLPTITERLLGELKLPDILTAILTNGVAVGKDGNDEWDLEELATVVATACQARSSDSLLDVLTLASELLPRLPTDGVWSTRVPVEVLPSSNIGENIGEPELSTPKVSKGSHAHAQTMSALAVKNARRVDIINSKPGILMSYFTNLMPVLIEVFGTTANSDIRRKTVECVAKVVAHSSDADMLTNALSKCKSFGKFVSDLIALKEVALAPDSMVPSQDRRDALILVSAGIQIAVTVTSKCGDRLAAVFAREGVLSEMERVVELGDGPTSAMTPAKLAASSSANDLVPYFKQMRNRSRLGGLLSALFDGTAPGSPDNVGGSMTTERLKRLKSLTEALQDAEEDDEEETGVGPAASIPPVSTSALASDAAFTEGKGKAHVSAEEQTGESSNIVKNIDKDGSTGKEKSKTPPPKTTNSTSSQQEYLQTLERLIQSEDTSPPPIPTIKLLNEESVSEADAHEWIFWTCRKTVADSRSDGAGLKKKDQVLEELRRLGAELRARAVPSGESETGGLALSTLRMVAEHFASQGSTDGSGITGFEIAESGIIDALADYLTKPSTRDMAEPPGPEEGEGDTVYTSSVLWRLRAFLHVFLNGPTPDAQNRNYFVPHAFRRLVQRLQESLARAERFEIASGAPSSSPYSSYDGIGIYGLLSGSFGLGPRESQNPSLQLARQLRIKLIADDPATVPSQYRALLVSVHAVATFQSIEEFLKPKIAYLSPSEGGSSTALAAAENSSSIQAAETVNNNGEGIAIALASASKDGIENEAAGTKPEVKTARTEDDEMPEASPADATYTEEVDDELAVAIRNDELGENENDEDHDMDDEYLDEGDDDQLLEDQTGNHLSDLLLHTEEMQRLNSGQNETPSNATSSTTGRGNSVVDLRLDAPSSSPATEPDPQLSQSAKNNASAGKQLAPPSTTDHTLDICQSQVSSTAASAFSSPSKSAEMSYASVAAASQNSFKIQFMIDGTPVKTTSTIFGALYGHERARRTATGQSSSQINVFSQIYSIKFKKVPIGEVESLDMLPEAPTFDKGIDTDSHLKVRLPFKANLPSGISKDVVVGKIMHLLRLLYGLNTAWHEVYSADEDEDTAVGVERLEGAAVAAEDGVVQKLAPHSYTQKFHVPHETTPAALAPLPLSNFNSSKLTAKLNRQLDEPLIVAARVLPTWCSAVARDFAFLVPFETRLVYLQSTSFGYSRSMNRWQQQQANASSSRRGDQPQLLGRMSRQKVRIPRSRLIDTMMKVMESWGSSQSLLEIEYQDEVGTGLGPTLEFYSSVCREVRLRSGVVMSSKSSQKKSSSATKDGLVRRNGAYRVWRDDGGMAATDAAKKQQADPNPTQVNRYKHKSSKGKGKSMKESLVQQEDAGTIPVEDIISRVTVEPAADEVVNSPLGLYPAPMTKDQATSEAGERVLSLFRHLGTFVAKALLDSRIIDLPFSPLFLQLAVYEDHPSSRGALLHAIKHVDPSLHASLLKLRQCVGMKKMIDYDLTLLPDEKVRRIKAIKIQDVSIEDLSLDFTLPGYPDIELVENGESIPLTLENLDLYIDRVAELTVSEGISKQIQAFREGFNVVFPIRDLTSFTVQELSLMMGGASEEDWSAMVIADALKADHGYSSTSPQVEWLVAVMAGYDVTQRREFLQFVTGAPKLPFGGFKALNPPLTIVRRDARKPNNDLPSVMTCTNYLKVPAYSSAEIMRRRFDVAIKEGAGCFHLS